MPPKKTTTPMIDAAIKQLITQGVADALGLEYEETEKKMMTDKYCPRGEIKKLEIELWNLKVKGLMYAKSSENKECTGTSTIVATSGVSPQWPANRNHENQAGGTKARRMVYALGGGETDQDLNNMEDDINA
ncbi:hypothetical protein Tco_1265572 [Tanacetum coccineum]